MAYATFNSLRGAESKSALIMVKMNILEYSASPAYVPLAAAEHFAGKKLTNDDKGFSFEIPDGFRLVDIVDSETGEVRTTKDGVNLKQITYSPAE